MTEKIIVFHLAGSGFELTSSLSYFIDFTCKSHISLVLLLELPDLDEVVQDAPDLLLVGDELVEEDHLGHIVVERSHLEPADLHVQREGVEGHGADEGDPGGHGVHDLKVTVEPEPLELAEDVEGLELLEVEDLGVGEPELFDEAHVDGDPVVQAFALLEDLKY